ncbi:MAG TPA: efflux RND transporter periplasmic adaptor subunit [Anaerovoracaceae bacterium]|nr:efflux RND transporter periplasmic adaptor subunit [Anaerovoracaceae bacterium]
MKLIKGKKWIVIAIAVVLVMAAAAYSAMNAGIAVESAVLDQGEVTKLLKETGTVESESAVTITAKNSGEIKGLTVEEGDSVKAGDRLMADGGTSAALDLKSQQAELSGLQAQYNQARDLANKNKALYDQGALSWQDYNASDAAAKQLAAQIASLQYAIQSYAESTGAGGVIAPMDGVLTGVFVKEGESVAPGAPLFEISNLNDIYVKTDFIAEDADLIREGDTARIFNEDAGFNDEKASVKKVHLKAADKMSDLGVNQKRVTVEIAFGAAAAVRLGSDVDVEITVEKKENVLRVSDLAVFEKNQTNCVYVIEGGKAVLREIETGLEGEDFSEVISGLSPGDIVILSPGDDIEGGVRVKVNSD